ncbi:ATPase associated with various cellular activities AAA_3 [Candidatus Moduliflexus flocculans]|uniref:ATPase associated with various cellular activities AAA_3 n=1 Tax=Candidatus Moduliflexus flocculans TaxID=1499966 RepID=A0A0S6VQC7_9BACT|nr:ATPase associated with various cellular activities AAA_3 [Candidatus Moduliflexus flocculans]
MYQDIRVINEMVQAESGFVETLKTEIAKVIVGQDYMVDRLLIGLLSDGHILLEGVPGLAKTLTVKTLSDCIQTKFQRIQFTPDLLPADLIGTMIYNQKEGVFVPKKGPIFTNIVLADEINRAPAKVQSGLLEAMQERQVTIGDTTFPLDAPFLVLATQNPIEQEGTYPLPEAQVDRFMLKLKISYPTRQEELQITERMAGGSPIVVRQVISPDDILRARSVVNQVYMDDKIKEYIIDIVFATREPKKYRLPELENMIEYGASPRASIYLHKAARAHAFLRRRGYVTPEDVKAVGLDILRHRVILSYEAEAEERQPEDIIKQIFDTVEVP